jgi:hypothetical protein
MYLLAGARLLLRRWITCLAGLVATFAGCFFVAQHVPVQHEATSQMLFILPPDATGEETPSNPFLNLPEGLITTANLVAGDQSTKDSMRALAAQGDTADYTIAVVQGSGPLLAISAIDADPEVALATRDALMARVDQQLLAMQSKASVPPDQVMRATRTSVSQAAEPKSATRTRAVVGTAVLGLVLVGLLALGVDQLLRRLARRRWAAAVASDEAARATPDDPERVPSETSPVDTAVAASDEGASDHPPGDPEGAPVESDPVLVDVGPSRAGPEGVDPDGGLAAVPIKGRRDVRARKRRPAQGVSIADSTVESVESVDRAERRPMAG